MSDIHMEKQAPRLLYPTLVIAAIAVIIFSLVGIAGITGHLPGASAGLPPAGTVAEKTCVECGVIESIRPIEVRGSGSGVGALVGGLGGALVGNTLGRGDGRTAMTIIGGGAGAYAGNEIEKNSNRHTVWQTRVRMDNGAARTLTTQRQPDFSVGSKVKVVDGQLVARG